MREREPTTVKFFLLVMGAETSMSEIRERESEREREREREERERKI